MIGAAARALPLIVALAGAVGGDVLASNNVSTGPVHPHWVVVTWPFPIDQWGAGRAFQCDASACGKTINLYFRPKIGFCSCSRGVYDDAELDRVGDIELIGPQFEGMGEGREVSVGWMRGRSREFTVTGPYQVTSGAAAIAFNNKCDVVVATVTTDGDLTGAERAALQFLNSDPVLQWARAELGSDGI